MEYFLGARIYSWCTIYHSNRIFIYRKLTNDIYLMDKFTGKYLFMVSPQTVFSYSFDHAKLQILNSLEENDWMWFKFHNISGQLCQKYKIHPADFFPKAHHSTALLQAYYVLWTAHAHPIHDCENIQTSTSEWFRLRMIDEPANYSCPKSVGTRAVEFCTKVLDQSKNLDTSEFVHWSIHIYGDNHNWKLKMYFKPHDKWILLF